MRPVYILGAWTTRRGHRRVRERGTPGPGPAALDPFPTARAEQGAMAAFTAGRYHVGFARVRTRRVTPSSAERPVLEALILLACLSESRLQAAAAQSDITKRWFAEGHAAQVGLVPLPEDIATHLRIPAPEVAAGLCSLVARSAIVLERDRILLPERYRRRAVAGWNERVKDDPLAQLPRVMYPRSRGGRPG